MNNNFGMHVYERTPKQKKSNEFVNIDGLSGPRGVKTRGKNVFCTFPHFTSRALLCGTSGPWPISVQNFASVVQHVYSNSALYENLSISLS